MHSLGCHSFMSDGKDVRLWVRDKGLSSCWHNRQHEFSCSHQSSNLLSLAGVMNEGSLGACYTWSGFATQLKSSKLQTCPIFAPERDAILDSTQICPQLWGEALWPSPKAIPYANILEKIVQTKNKSCRCLG